MKGMVEPGSLSESEEMDASCCVMKSHPRMTECVMFLATKNLCCVALDPRCTDAITVPMLSTGSPMTEDAIIVDFSSGLLCDAGIEDRKSALSSEMCAPVSKNANA